MKNTIYSIFLLTISLSFYNCFDKDISVADESKSTNNNFANRISLNEISATINNNEFSFNFDKDNFDIFLNTEFGMSKIEFEYDDEISLIADSRNSSLKASLGTDYEMDLRNMKFEGNTINFDEYRNNVFYRSNKVELSEIVNKTNFFNSLDSNLLLDNNNIHTQLNLKACPPCVVLIIVIAATVVSDSNEQDSDWCLAALQAVIQNCANRPGYCVEVTGPCSSKCRTCE